MEPELIFEGDLGGVFSTEGEQSVVSVHEGEVEPVETEVSVEGIQLEEIHGEPQQIIVEDETLGQTIHLIPQIPQTQQTEIIEDEISFEESLKSHERLDRSSPDLWPQNLPTAAQHILAKNQSKTGESDSNLGIWAQGLDPEDINLLHQFGSLTSSSLVEEVKKLQNIAYQLGLEESKEMTRGKLLHVLDDSAYHSKQEKESHVQRLWK